MNRIISYERVAELYQLGINVPEVACEMRIGVRSVYRALKDAGVEIRKERRKARPIYTGPRCDICGAPLQDGACPVCAHIAAYEMRSAATEWRYQSAEMRNPAYLAVGRGPRGG